MLKPTNECTGLDSKQCDAEAPILEFGGMWNTLLLTLFPVPLGYEVVLHVRIPSMGIIELYNH